MGTTSRFWPGAVLAFVAAGMALTGCADDAPLGPTVTTATIPQIVPATATATAGSELALPDLGACDSLAAPAGNRLAVRLYAEGDQIYRWSGTAWTFVAPAAVLYPGAQATGKIGIHYGGPTWEAVSGSKVVGAVLKRCPAGSTAIPWLLLQVVADEGPGLFSGATLIQRINTVGGIAPTSAGSFVGEESRVPYTAEYLFYQAD